MTEETINALQKELHEMSGAVNILDILREEMEIWVEEAQDESKREALENVLNHIAVLESEYRVRRDKLKENS